jgi:hypothetical protein
MASPVEMYMTFTSNEKIILLRAAIKELKQVTAVYNGLPREFCVHLLGTKNGDWKVLVWQFGGSSSKADDIPNWRDWHVGKITDLSLRDGEWHRGWETGRRTQKSMDRVDTAVDHLHSAEILGISDPRIRARAPSHLSRRR